MVNVRKFMYYALKEDNISYMTINKADNYEVIDEEDCKANNNLFIAASKRG